MSVRERVDEMTADGKPYDPNGGRSVREVLRMLADEIDRLEKIIKEMATVKR